MAAHKKQDDRVVPATHLKWVCCDVPKKYTKDNVLYLVRLFCRSTGAYYYKVGFTNDLLARVTHLNKEYDACGRLIVVMTALCKSIATEKTIHKEMKEHLLKIEVGGKKRKELYDISYASHLAVLLAFDARAKKLWHTKYYGIDEGVRADMEWYKSCDDADDERLTRVVSLSQGKKEQDMWHELLRRAH